MSTKRYTVTCHWDEEARVWYVAETDVPGLATEAETVEAMEQKLLTMVPELLTLNESPGPTQSVAFEIITRKDELAQCA
jgi:predicted RNase H-like HicB family nuclease